MDDTAFEVGQKYCIRTNRCAYTGLLLRITPTELVFDHAAWIPNVGPLSHALATGEFRNVEPFPLPMLVSRHVIMDATIWPHDLPTADRLHCATLQDEQPCAVLSGVASRPLDDRPTGRTR